MRSRVSGRYARHCHDRASNDHPEGRHRIADHVNVATVSLLIAGLILRSSVGVFKESTTVLLEGTPAGTNMPALIDTIESVAGVLDVHDLHVWMVGPGVVACSCHLLVAEQSIREGQQVLLAVVSDLEHHFNIKIRKHHSY
jgi:Co/Zn/Cd efflux system component